MHAGWSEEFVREKNARMLAEAEERRLARLAVGETTRHGLRARVARKLFGVAVAIEGEETWRVVWESLENPRRT